jgi:hypothetical protein
MRKAERSAAASAFTRVFDALWRSTAGPRHKITKTTPCKVERPRPAALRRVASGAPEEKWSVVTRVSEARP